MSNQNQDQKGQDRNENSGTTNQGQTNTPQGREKDTERKSAEGAEGNLRNEGNTAQHDQKNTGKENKDQQAR
jgi:hypothetical protein